MNKRAIAILGAIFILIVGALGFLIYSRSKSNNTESATEQIVETPVVEETPIIEEPTAPQAQAVRLTDDAVISPILFYQGNGISYFNSAGQLFQTDLDDSDGKALLSNKRELSIALLSDISRILWPQAGNGFLAESVSAGKFSWRHYDSVKSSYIDIPYDVFSLDWMPTGDKIVYVWVDANGKATLNIGNPDTTGYQVLTTFYESDNIVKVSPDGRQILFYSAQSTDTSKNPITMVSIDGKVFQTVVADGYNSGVLWSPDSKKFLFGKRDPGTQKFNLWVADLTSGEIKSLGVASSVTKAVWTKDGQSVFVGVPNSGIAGQGLTQDSLYKISVSSGSQEQFDPGVTVDAQNLFLNSAENILFFKNAQDGSLYYIPVM